MTAEEKRRMKSALLSYATTHPVKSGLLSPYMFRYATMALASLVIVLGGSIGITNASMKSLPNQRLYPIKLWVEEFKAKNQNTPEAVIAYETKRIETRFDEATKLALKQELNDNTSAIIQSGLEHSRETIRSTADTLQNKNPELALAATNILETTFSSNGKILASIEQNTNQNIGTIVLAAQVTTKKLATEKIKFEQIVSLKPNDDTKSQAVSRLAVLEKKLSDLPEEVPAPAVTAASDTDIIVPITDINPSATLKTASGTPTISATTLAVPMAAKVQVTTPGTVFITGAVAPTAEPVEAPKSFETIARELTEQAKKKMDMGLYSESLVLIQKAEQLLDEASLTQSLETTYKVKATKDQPKSQ